MRPAKRGPGAKPSAERARHNRARNLQETRRKENYKRRQAQHVETTREVIEKRSRLGEPDSPEYLARQAEHAKFITIFGRKTVREALRDEKIKFRHIHMDENVVAVNSNVRRIEADPVILEILDLARERNVTIIPIDRARLSYISKAAKQDGGVVADLLAPEGSKFSSVSDFLKVMAERHTMASATGQLEGHGRSAGGYTILALDQITTPANMGMILRSAVASQAFRAILVGPGSVAVNNPLVIKASASTALLPAKTKLSASLPDQSTIFITHKDSMFQALNALKQDGAEIVLLAAQKNDPQSQAKAGKNATASSSTSLWDFNPPEKCVFVIGGESEGHDPAVQQVATTRVHIPMAEGVESLNCAVTAALVSFHPKLRTSTRL